MSAFNEQATKPRKSGSVVTQEEEISRALSLFIDPAGLLEIRAPKPLNGAAVWVSHFEPGQIDAAIAAVVTADAAAKYQAIYCTLNPVKPVASKAANDRDVVHRRRLLVDCDPVRTANTSATDDEHQSALERAVAIRDWLTERDWPLPVVADSSNGGHLIYAIDLPNNEASDVLIHRCLKALNSRFSDDAVGVDTTVKNASRITKIYGTVSRKGDDTRERPHRRSRLLEVPDRLLVVPVDLLRELAGLETPGQGAIRRGVQIVRNAIDGEKHGALNRAAYLLGGYVGSGVVVEDVARAALRDAIRAKANVADFNAAYRVIDDGLAAGKCVPTTGKDPEKARAESAPNTTYRPHLNEVAPLVDEDLFSDYGNVVKLLARLSGRLAYTPGMDWLLYNPATGVWEPEPKSERVKRLALETLRDAWSVVLYGATRKVDDLKKQIKDTDSDDPKSAMLAKNAKMAGVHKEKVYAWIRQCETAYRLRSTLEIAEGYFWVDSKIWDKNPHILICANGALDLATGQLLPHSPNYRATKSTGTHFTPGATHPAWNAVVALLQSEGDRYEFIHQYCGSGLHGENPNELIVIFQGDAGTGKGTLLTGIHRALGAYAETVEVGTLLATDWRKQNKSAPREDLIKLRGARFVYPSIEPPKDSKLDDGSIKALSGNDSITARLPHAQQSISFSPVFKLALQTNFPLRTEFDDPGMKRRVIVVPFNSKPETPDPSIKNALMNDPTAQAAALAWLYEGYRVWRGNGFALPISTLATEATAGYWKDMNPFEQFAADVGLVFGKAERCLKPRMTGAFKAWREESGRTDAAHRDFPAWLKRMGCYEGWDSNKNRIWHGVSFSGLPPVPPVPPQNTGNNTVGNKYSKSTNSFTVNDGGIGGIGGNSSNGALLPVDSVPTVPDGEKF